MSYNIYLEKKIEEFRNKSDYFEEYIVLFYVFIKRLHKLLVSKKIKEISFLSREGHFLKELFDIYQKNKISNSEKIESKYFMCSRHAIDVINPDRRKVDFFTKSSIKDYLISMGLDKEEIPSKLSEKFDIDLIIDDFPNSIEFEFIRSNIEIQQMLDKRYKENRNAFFAYTNSIFGDEDVYICDIGYAGTVQYGLEKVLKKKTKGFYLGRIGDIEIDLGLSKDEILDKSALIFDCSFEKNNSYIDHILRSNMLICEMLLYAPHGSIQRYSFENEDIKIIDDWDLKEKKLYYLYIANIQEKMKEKFVDLCLNDPDNEDEEIISKVLAKMVLKSGLLANKNRIDFLKELQKSMYTNYRRDAQKIKFRVSDTKINILDMISHPELYSRYFVKLPVFFSSNNLSFVNFFVSRIIYIYICFKTGLFIYKKKIN